MGKKKDSKDSMGSIGERVGRYMEDVRTGKCEGMAQVLAAWAGGCSIDAVAVECMRTHPGVAPELRQRGWTVTPHGLERGRKRQPAAQPRSPVLVLESKTFDEERGDPAAKPTQRHKLDREPMVFKGSRERGAAFSPCGQYRYACWSTWSPGTLREGGGILVVVGHNPSTADHEAGDPTFNRGVGFARRMGYAGVCFVNLASYRATDPKALREVERPFGHANGHAWAAALRWGGTILAAWGNHRPELGCYASQFIGLAKRRRIELMCMGTTNGGNPKHLMARGTHRIPDDKIPEAWP